MIKNNGQLSIPVWDWEAKIERKIDERWKTKQFRKESFIAGGVVKKILRKAVRKAVGVATRKRRIRRHKAHNQLLPAR